MVGSLPDTLSQLTKLVRGHFQYNLIPALPAACLTKWTNLEELDISGNKLKELPSEISCCKALKRLCVSENELTALPSTVSMRDHRGCLVS